MAETARPQPSTAWDRTTRPSAAWTALVRSAGTDEERACIAAATRQADRVWIALHTPRLLKLTGANNQSDSTRAIPGRNSDWHRLALSAYEVLRGSAAYGHLAQLRPLTCAAVEPVLAQWLQTSAPARPGDKQGEQVSVAQRLGIGDAVHRINGETLAAHLSTVVNAAQDAGVFGIPHHRVELVTAPATHDAGTVVRVVVDTPHGLALTSPPLQLGVLVEPDARGVAAATGALVRVADVATGLFAIHAHAVWHHPPPMPMVDRSSTATGQAFPKLRLDQRAAPPVPPIPAPAPSPAIAPRTTVDESPRGRSR